MTPAERQQLEVLIREQRRLSESVAAMQLRLERFYAAVDREPPPVVVPPPILPQRERDVEGLWSAGPQPTPPPTRARDEVPPRSADPAPLRRAVPAPAPVALPQPRAPATSVPLAEPAPPAEPVSLEMTLGTVWLSRIGIVILLTGLVFLGNYARQWIVPHLTPGGKVALLYLASAALGGLGVWLERRPQSTGRYPQVLMAGGAAMAYYTTFAMHFVARLRVIESPLVAGVLLLIVAGIFIWWADRRKFQTAALLGVVLSYYTAAINPVGSYTIYSNVVLTAAAGFLLVRNGWATVSWVSLAGTYGSYFYWVYFSHDALPIDPVSFEEVRGAVLGNVWMLATYWSLFTASVFVARPEALSSLPRTTFLTLNNGLFFALASYYLRAHHPAQYWAFALAFGVVLLALALLARHRRVEDYALDGAFLAQGLAAVTAGLAWKLNGPSLPITLALESAVLLTAVTRRHGVIYRIAAVGLAVWAFWLTAGQMLSYRPEHLVSLGGTVAAILLFDAWWLKQRSGWLPLMRWSWRAAGFAGLGLLLIFLVVMIKVHAPWEPAALALVAVLATASLALLRLPEVVLLGQFFLGAAVAGWLSRAPDLGSFNAQHPYVWNEFWPWWNPLPLLLAALALSHWWIHQQTVARRWWGLWHFLCAAGFIGVGFYWAALRFHDSAWVVCTVCAGVGTLLYGTLTGAWGIGLLGQVFNIAAITAVFLRFERDPLPGPVALLPLAGHAAAGWLLARRPLKGWPAGVHAEREGIGLLYWFAGVGLLIGWIFTYVASPWRGLVFAAWGAVLVLAGVSRPSRLLAYTGVALLGLSYLIYFRPHPEGLLWPDLLGFLLAPAAVRFARARRPEFFAPKFANVVTAAATGFTWLWVTRWMTAHGYRDLLTLAWSALAVAVFVAGLTLRDRIYRMGGFLILALAVGRIFIVDVARLETIYRILSFLGLGVVLLALGFIYNRYAEKIRRWL